MKMQLNSNGQMRVEYDHRAPLVWDYHRPFICSIPPVFYKSGLLLRVEKEGEEAEQHSCVIEKEDRAHADPDGYQCVRFWLKCADGKTRIFFVCPFSRFDGPGTIIHTDRPGNRQTLCVAC